MFPSIASLTHLLYDKPSNTRLVGHPDPGSVSIARVPSDVRTPHERLAALDSAPVLEGDVLIAYVDDEPWAAISLLDGRVVADPFRPSSGLVRHLRLHRSGWRAREQRDAVRDRVRAVLPFMA